MCSYHRKKKQIPIIGYFRVLKEYLYKSKIWQSETSPNQGIPNQVPWLGLLLVRSVLVQNIGRIVTDVTKVSNLTQSFLSTY